MSKMVGTPWHVGYLKNNDENKRSKKKCVFYGTQNSCMHLNNVRCTGTSHCAEYSENSLDYKKSVSSTNRKWKPSALSPMENQKRKRDKERNKRIAYEQKYRYFINNIVYHTEHGLLRLIKIGREYVIFINQYDKKYRFSKKHYENMVKRRKIELMSYKEQSAILNKPKKVT